MSDGNVTPMSPDLVDALLRFVLYDLGQEHGHARLAKKLAHARYVSGLSSGMSTEEAREASKLVRDEARNYLMPGWAEA